MARSSHFAYLGAPLTNSRWSWGSIRQSDNAVFLLVWQDQTRKHEDRLFARVAHYERFQDQPDNLGYRERLSHLELVRQGATCYLVMGIPKDVAAVNREVKELDEGYVFPAGRLVELDGDTWLEMLPRIAVRQVRRTSSGDKQ